MKLEAEDIKNTNRLCVAHIGDVIDSRILVKFDGFDSCYDFWTDIRSPYIHPTNFHVDNGYSIISPPGEPILNTFPFPVSLSKSKDLTK